MERKKHTLRQPLDVLETDPALGLTDAQVGERMEKGWANGIPASVSKSEWEIIGKNLLTFFNLVFVTMAVILALAGSSVKNMTFMIVVICNLCIGCYQEIRAKRAVDKLTLVAAQKIRTLRNGEETAISSELLVRDDIVFFAPGDQICADGVLLEGNLQVNEALITGEEDPVSKQAGDPLFSGSIVIAGIGKTRLTAVGWDSFAAKLALEAKKDPRASKSEMMNALDKLIRVVGFALIPVGLALFYQEFAALERGLTASAEATVAALVGMIPEGLYLLTSIAMAASCLKLAFDKVLVKDMNCIEALARTDIVCVDKTGTITESVMEVEQVIPLTQDPPERLEQIMTAYYTGSDPENDTARAMVEVFGGETNWECVHRIPFTSQTKWSAAIFRGQGAFVVGAPEFVMGHRYEEIREDVEYWSKKGSRVLLVSQHAGELKGHLEPGKLRVLALIVLSNRIRKAAAETFRYFREQGVTVKVISGDNPLAVSQVALRAGIPGAENYADASAWQTDEELAEAAESCTVFGRVTPEQKKKLLAAMKAAGHTVAMAGDGVNDVLAMKESDCSVALASGAQAASQVAQLVLLKSDFAAMPAIVGEGRRVINNIQRAASLFLVKNILSLGLAVVTLFTKWPYPFQPLHLTLISSLTIGIPSFFLAMEPNYERVTGKFLPTVLRRALPGGMTNLVMVLLTQLVMTQLGCDTAHISTACAAVIGAGGLAVLFETCKPYNPLRRILWGAMAGAMVLGFTAFAGFFNLAYGPLSDVLIILVLLVATPTVFVLISWLLKRMTKGC